MYSIYNYWYKTRMWRPMNNFASLYFENSSYCCNAYNSNYGDNPFATKGYFGYDRAWCENESQVMLWPVTCVVYNWDA